MLKLIYVLTPSDQLQILAFIEEGDLITEKVSGLEIWKPAGTISMAFFHGGMSFQSWSALLCCFSLVKCGFLIKILGLFWWEKIKYLDIWRAWNKERSGAKVRSLLWKKDNLSAQMGFTAPWEQKNGDKSSIEDSWKQISEHLQKHAWTDIFKVFFQRQQYRPLIYILPL